MGPTPTPCCPSLLWVEVPNLGVHNLLKTNILIFTNTPAEVPHYLQW